MARIRFTGDSETCVWLGVTFRRGQWLSDHGLDAVKLGRIARHPHFEVEAPPPPAKTRRRR